LVPVVAPSPVVGLKRKLVVGLLATLLLTVPPEADARGGGHSSHVSSSHASSHRRSASHSPSSVHHRSTYSSTAIRDKDGKIKRSPAARSAFKRSHPCPSTGRGAGACPGYVVDHVQALKHGGRDDPSNMQWQTVQAAKAKDKWE
jgi:hypothetical protein